MIKMMKIMLKINVIKNILKTYIYIYIYIYYIYINMYKQIYTATIITRITSKTLVTDKAVTGEEGKKLIYCIETMNRLPCLMCSVNITFIKTKRGI